MRHLRDFEDIYAIAAERKGGVERLERMLAETPTLPAERIAAKPDDRVLAAMTRAIFSAGFALRLVEEKWDAFEQAFENFDPETCAHLPDEKLAALTQDPTIVRSGPKIWAVRSNAQFLLELARENGSAARLFANWPPSEFVDLVLMLRRSGARLGGETPMRFLRALGKPAFVNSPDMTRALIREGVLVRPVTGRSGLLMIQDAISHWSDTSGRDWTVISRVLGMSIGQNRQQAKPLYPWEELGL